MIDLRAHELLRQELGGRRPLPWKGNAEELREETRRRFGPASRQARGVDTPLAIMASACAAAAYRLYGIRAGGPRAAIDIIVRAAVEPEPPDMRVRREEWETEIHG